ncbi:hypothetical protein D3C78_813280 [compost metagenome]
MLAQWQGFTVEQITSGVLRVELQTVQREMPGRVDGVGPCQVLVETYVDHRQSRQRRAHHVQLARDGQVHLVKAHAADPRKMRIGQQHAAPIEGAVPANGHGVTTAVQRKALQARGGDLEGRSGVLLPGESLGRRGTDQRFGKLADTAFDQQASSQFDQVQCGNRPDPVPLALFGQTLCAALTQIAVVPGHIAFNQLPHGRGLRLPEANHRLGAVQPTEKHIADAIFPLFKGELLRAEIT